MNQEQVLAWAREAGLPPVGGIVKFAYLVAAKLFTYEQVKAHIQAAVLSEREECAKACEKIDLSKKFFSEPVALECAAAIRARSDT